MKFDPTRRALLQGAAIAIASRSSVWTLAQDEELVDFADLDGFKTESSPRNPRIKFLDLRRLTSWKTPENDFFSFHQTETVQVDASTWSLKVGGFVENPLQLTLDQLRRRPDRRDIAVTIECSGNAAGPAANGMISNGVWSGVGLRSLLEQAKLKPEAREIAFFGMDMERDRASGMVAAHGRSVYIQDAMEPNAMLAFELNGKPLPAERGYPVRVILPGWYGMTHIKWLSGIEVLDRRYEGTHMSRNYHTVHAASDTDDQLVMESAITRTRLKSVVARVTRRRDAYKISGAAWGGPSPIKAVEVNVNGGPWRAARIDERGDNTAAGPFAWVLWSLDWTDAGAGTHTLISRAIDEQGRIQPTLQELRRDVKSVREDNSQWPRKIILTEI